MENGGPTDSLKVQRNTFLKELSAHDIDPYEDTGGVSYTMYSIGVMREPIGRGRYLSRPFGFLVLVLLLACIIRPNRTPVSELIGPALPSGLFNFIRFLVPDQAHLRNRGIGYQSFEIRQKTVSDQPMTKVGLWQLLIYGV